MNLARPFISLIMVVAMALGAYAFPQSVCSLRHTQPTESPATCEDPVFGEEAFESGVSFSEQQEDEDCPSPLVFADEEDPEGDEFLFEPTLSLLSGRGELPAFVQILLSSHSGNQSRRPPRPSIA